MAAKPRRPTRSTGPAIFFFQPTDYKWIEPAGLAEWEATMAEKVGIVPVTDGTSSSPARAARRRSDTAKSYFKCGGKDWDGCDTV